MTFKLHPLYPEEGARLAAQPDRSRFRDTMMELRDEHLNFCPRCDGGGGNREPCLECDGSGRRCGLCSNSGVCDNAPCPACGCLDCLGWGRETNYPDEKCRRCKGKGQLLDL